MEVVIGSLLEGARQAVGHVAIIDVFRAFTTTAVALTRVGDSVAFVFGRQGFMFSPGANR